MAHGGGGGGRLPVVLAVAEKPSVAKGIAQLLNGGALPASRAGLRASHAHAHFLDSSHRGAVDELLRNAKGSDAVSVATYFSFWINQDAHYDAEAFGAKLRSILRGQGFETDAHASPAPAEQRGGAASRGFGHEELAGLPAA